MKDLYVTKASGEAAIFSVDKLKTSLRNSGASKQKIDQVINEITPKLYQGISTKKLYRWAFNILKKGSRHVAARYHLKSAIMELGPTGFPFEKFIEEIFKKLGYSTQNGVFIEGKCVRHEVDVIAHTDKDHLLIECKYHNQQGKISDVKIPLYIQSRFRDINFVWENDPHLKNKNIEGWVVTNTRFSFDAIKYGNCVGLKLLGWDYPKNKGLKDLIDEYHMYPVTTLTSLTIREKEKLLENNIIIVGEIFNKKDVLKKLKISEYRSKTILDEVMKMIGENIKK